MANNLKTIAMLLGVPSESDARKFCEDVQRAFYGFRHNTIPSFQTIANCLRKFPDARGNAERAAQHLKGIQIKTNIVAPRPTRERSPRGGLLDAPSTPIPALKHDSRKFTEKFKTCRHGVPCTGVCHICKGGKIDY